MIAAMAISVSVSEVEPATERMSALDREEVIPRLLSGPPNEISSRRASFLPPPPPPRRVEAYARSDARLVVAQDTHALAEAARAAFYRHHPLALSPDAVWFCIAQGFARHVALNAETLRARLVAHEGKLTLSVVRPDFVLGADNPWPEVFTSFSEAIATHVGKLRDLVVADFSTTGPLERAASEVVLIDAFQSYFDYEMYCGCGIPSVTLLGCPDDWRSVRRRAAALSEYGLTWWTDALLPVLDEIVNTAEGRVDRAFWQSLFRYQSGSGPAELTGWILTLFPYLRHSGQELDASEPNHYLAGWEEGWRRASARTGRILTCEGPGLDELPGSIAGAPVRFVDLRDGSTHSLRFLAGLFGVTQDASSGTLAPEFGWAVVHEPSDESGSDIAP